MKKLLGILVLYFLFIPSSHAIINELNTKLLNLEKKIDNCLKAKDSNTCDQLEIVTTFLIGIVTYYIVYFMSKYLLIYGRRRLILCLLLGFLIGYIIRLSISEINFDINYIGFIIPGLIASWMDRQGIVRTMSVILIVASIVHLFLILILRLS